MPSTLEIEGTELTPHVILDSEQGIFEISGRSLPEDSLSFYFPIQEWLEDYIRNPNDFTEFKFKFEYFNSSSNKQILKIIKKLLAIIENGKKSQISWYYIKDDEITRDRGIEIKAISNIPFVLKEY